MKNKIISLFLVVLIILSSFFIYLHLKNLKETNSEDDTHLLHGIIYDISNNNLTVKNSSGAFYTFNLLEQQNIANLFLGSTVAIKFRGQLDSSLNFQHVTVKSISISACDNDIPKAYQDHGIFNKYYNRAYAKLQKLSLDEKIGQLLLVRVPEKDQLEAIHNYHLGGYILFSRDTKNETKKTLIDKINSYQQVAKIPLIIAVDEEGGSVVRISNNKNLRSSKFSSPQEIYQEYGLEGIKQTTKEMSQLLESLHINLNLAPVADVSTNPNDFIYKRSLGQDAKTTAKYIQTVINTSHDYSVAYTLKHFPGYGNNLDTHNTFSIDKRSLESLKENDLIPFQAGIDAKAQVILVSHNIIKTLDNKYPASLSLPVHNLAREYLGFTGILLTDDLDMDAIKKYANDSAVVKAILAGNDMIIVSDYKEAITEIQQALENKTITEELINYNVFRILAWKYYMGLL